MSIMDEYVERCGWNIETQLDLALQYIANQGSDDAFADFLETVASEEEAESADYPDDRDAAEGLDCHGDDFFDPVRSDPGRERFCSD